jgi:hypothetical protein
MYENAVLGRSTGEMDAKMDNPTVEENINRKIKYHQMEIARLEAAKQTMQPLLHMKLGDMREVMSY